MAALKHFGGRAMQTAGISGVNNQSGILPFLIWMV